MSDRTTYREAQSEARRRTTEQLQRFKELHPEKYAELASQAKQEASEPVLTRHVIRHSPSIVEPLTADELAKRIEDIDRRIYDPKKRHYYIKAKDQWGDEHTFFESLIPDEATNDSALSLIIKKHPRHLSTTITSLEPCQCPACIRRHGS